MTNIVKKFAEFVLQGRFWAILIAVLLVFLPFFRWAGWAVLGLVTLRKGALEGSFVLAGIALSVVVTGFAITSTTSPAGMTVELVLFGIIGILATGIWLWILANVLRSTASWSKVFQVALWMGLGIIVLVQLIYPDIAANWWAPMVKDNLANMQKSLPELVLSEKLVMQIASVMTGGYVALTLLMVLFGLWIARWLQAMLYNPGGLRQELVTIRVGVLEVAAAVVVALWMMMGDPTLVIGFIPVIGLVFIFAGLSLVHRLLRMIKKPWLGAIVFYMLLLGLFRYMVLVLIGLALIDALINVRERLMLVRK